MKLSSHHIVTLSLLLLLLSACSTQNVQDDEVLARVGNVVLTKADARAQIPIQILAQDSTTAYNEFINSWIRKQLILQEVDRTDLINLPEIQSRIERAKEEAILSSFRDVIMLSIEDEEIEVTEEEARSYYQENRDKFLLSERYIRFRHLVAATLSDAENARRAIMRGIDWEEVANEYCIYPELKIRESKRYWAASTALEEYTELNRYLQVIGVTEISIIERIGGQYHFVQLVDQRAEGEHPDLDWLISEIKEWLMLEKKRRFYNSYLNNLYLSAQANNEIEIFNVLPNGKPAPVRTDTLDTITE